MSYLSPSQCLSFGHWPLAVASGLTALLTSTLAAETLTVCSEGPCQFTDIQSAIDWASPGDVIQIAAGTYQPSATLVTMGKAVTLIGAVDSSGAPATLLDGSDLIRVIECWSNEGPDTRFENLLITNGFGPDGYGGGMSLLTASPTIVNCHFIGNTSTDVGGGLHNYEDSHPIIEGCSFIGNSASYAGGGVMNEAGSAPIFRHCIFSDNEAALGGGVANLKSHGVQVALFEDCIIKDNQAFSEGGGVHNDYNSPDFVRCRVSTNVAGDSGGGIYNNSSQPTLFETVVCGNDPDQIQGSWVDLGGNTVDVDCPLDCAADFNDDGRIDGADFGFLLASWGSCPDCEADLNGDGAVGGADIGLLLALWGPCP